MRFSTPKGRFSDDFRRNVAELYMSDSNMTTRGLAEKYSCHHSTMWRILSERVPKDILTQRRRGIGLPKFTQKIEWEIASKYLNDQCVTVRELAEEYNCAPETLARYLHKNGITKDFIIKRAAQVIANKRLRRISKSAETLTPDKAWIFGVLCGDAHHDVKNGRIILESGVKKTDWEFLALWRKKLEGVYGIRCAEWRRKGQVTGYVLTSRAASNDVIKCLPSSGAYSWRVPGVIMEGNDEVQQKFLEAFFDSEAFFVGTGIALKSVNKEGLGDVQQLLSAQGIASRVTGPHRETQKKCLDCSKRMSLKRTTCGFCSSVKLENVVRAFYLLMVGGYRNIVTYAEKVGFDLLRKRKRLRALVERRLKFIRDPCWRREEIHRAIAKGARSSTEIAKETNMKLATVQYHINSLLGKGSLRRGKGGTYALSEY